MKESFKRMAANLAQQTAGLQGTAEGFGDTMRSLKVMVDDVEQKRDEL